MFEFDIEPIFNALSGLKDITYPIVEATTQALEEVDILGQLKSICVNVTEQLMDYFHR